MLYNLTLSTILLTLQSYPTIVLYNALQSYLYSTLQSYSAMSTIVLYSCTLVLYSTIVLYNSKVIYNLCMYGMGRPGRNMSVADIDFRKLLLVYCPGHAGVKGNDRGDRLVDKATLTSGLPLGRSKLLRNLRLYLRAQSQGYHTIDRLQERCVETGSSSHHSDEHHRWNSFKGSIWGIFWDGVERIWDFPSA